MRTTQCAARTVAAKETSQFELTTNIITKLNNYKLTPTAKLVLLYLTTCYNPKHKEVFPKQKTIADKLGVSERSVTRAIQELFKEGLILIECKYTNRYKFTSKIVQEQLENMSDEIGQKDTQQEDNLSHHYIEPIKEHDKEPQVINKGGNVYKGDDLILRDYAIKHGADNENRIRGYVNKLKETKSAEKIIKEYNKKNASLGMAYNYNVSQNWLQQQVIENQLPACSAQSIGLSLSDLKKRGIIK